MTTNWSIINDELEPLEGWQVLSEEIEGEHSYLVEYYKKCRSGEIIIGRELATTLEGLIQDIFIHNDVYKFELKPAHKRINFIEREVKHFEAPFAGKPFLLELWQKAFAEALFAFKVFDDTLLGGGRWVRRFKEVLLLIARKNGKTPFAAALTLAEFVCGEAGQKVMCASNDYDQASLVFDCINNFREESSSLSKVTRKNIKGIFWGNPRQHKKTGKFSSQNKGNIKKLSARQSAKEGRNLKTVIVDEIHEMKDDSTVLPLRSSLTTQDEPLYLEISTEGIVRDGYLDERLKQARHVLHGEADKPRWLIWLYTQDSELEVWKNEEAWAKSNPMLGVVKKVSDLRDLVEDARISASKRAFTLAKEFNLKQLSAQAWLEERWISVDKTFDLEEFRGSWCIVGTDLSETNDLCAVSFLLMKPNDPTMYFHTMYFVTAVKANDLMSTSSPTNVEKKDYKQWAQDGYCRIINDVIIDDEIVADYLKEIYDKYKIRPFRNGYDEWHAKEYIKRVSKTFGEQVPIKVRMLPSALNVPTRMLEEYLRAGNVNYQNNPICAWCFRNTAIKYDHIGNVMPEKIKGYVGNKIDGTMSKVIACAVFRETKSAFMSRIGD